MGTRSLNLYESHDTLLMGRGHPCPLCEVLARRYPFDAVDCRTATILLKPSQYNNTVRPTGKQPIVETGSSKSVTER